MTGNNRRIMGCLAGLTFLISLLLTSSVHSVTAQEKPREARSAAKVTHWRWIALQQLCAPKKPRPATY